MSPADSELLGRAPVARLATVDRYSRPHLVPVVYVEHNGLLIVPLDSKKKSVRPDLLKRVRNIKGNPRVCLLVDEYHNDWKKLRFVMVHGSARLGKWSEKELAQARAKSTLKYRQYETFDPGEFCIVITPDNVVTWKNDFRD